MNNLPDDQHLQAALRQQRELMELYKQGQKSAPDKHCKELYKQLRSALDAQVEQVASELARHRMARGLGQSLDQDQP